MEPREAARIHRRADWADAERPCGAETGRFPTSASSRMHEADPKVRAAQLDEGRRFIDLANRLSVPHVAGVLGVPGETRTGDGAGLSTGSRTLGEHERQRRLRGHRNRTATSPTVRRCLVEDPQGAAMPTRRPALGRAPYLCREQGRPGRDVRGPRARAFDTRTGGFVAPKAQASPRKPPSTGSEPSPSARRSRCWPRWLPRGRRLRMGEGVASGDRGPRSRVPHHAEFMRRALTEAGVKPVTL